MDYVYHYYNNWDHGSYGQSSSSILSKLTGHCSCTCLTCLYKLDLLLILIVIYLLLMDKITININTSTITTTTTTTTTTRLPLVPVRSNNIVTSTSEIVSSSKSPTPTPIKCLSLSPPSSSSSSISSSFVKVKTSLINSSLPWDTMILNDSHGEMMINSERSTPSDQPESLADSLNSFCSYGSLRRKLIKPDISLDFLDSSSSESESIDGDDDDKSNKRKKNKKRIKKKNKKQTYDTDNSLEECNVFSGCANDEHFYRDSSLSEETFTNDRITVIPSSIHCS